MCNLIHIGFTLLCWLSILQGASSQDDGVKASAQAPSDHIFLQTAVKTHKRAQDAKVKASEEAAAKMASTLPDPSAMDLEGTCGPFSSDILSGVGAASCGSRAPLPSRPSPSVYEAGPTLATSRLQTGTVVKKVVLDLSEDED
mmetsp:Transcript_52205/g.124447  ORF Transcript_52205/g.124447 Transcript_52205/m.124447 type:complete len:143 (-) Transcript_52205:85-513(-)